MWLFVFTAIESTLTFWHGVPGETTVLLGTTLIQGCSLHAYFQGALDSSRMSRKPFPEGPLKPHANVMLTYGIPRSRLGGLVFSTMTSKLRTNGGKNWKLASLYLKSHKSFLLSFLCTHRKKQNFTYFFQFLTLCGKVVCFMSNETTLKLARASVFIINSKSWHSKGSLSVNPDLSASIIP